MQYLKLALVFSLLILLLSCNNKVGNFTVSTPDGWIVVDTVSSRYGKFVKMHPPATSLTPQFIENINISIVNFPSIDIYINSVLSDIKKDAFRFEDKGRGTMKINKYNVKWERHIIQDKNSDPIEQKGFFIEDGGNIYQIIYSTRANEQDKFQKELNDVLQSFKII